MLYILKINEYLKSLTNEEVKDFVTIYSSKYFKSTIEKLHSNLNEEQNLKKVAKSLYIFLTTPDEVENYVESNFSDSCVHHYNVEILNLFDPELQLINTALVIKNKLKELLSELEKFKVWTILVLNPKKRFHSIAKLIASDSDIDKTFKSIHQSIMTKTKNNAS